MTNDHETAGGAVRRGRLLRSAGVLAAGLLAGGVLAGTLAASADTTTPSSSPSASSGSSSAPAAGQQHGPVGGATPVRSDEKALTGTTADKVRAAALAALPGGTVYRVETDADGAVYEAHLTKADGTAVTVKLGADFAVTAVQDGMGSGPARPGGPPSVGAGSGSSGATPSAGA